jgi:hypothetical protein
MCEQIRTSPECDSYKSPVSTVNQLFSGWGVSGFANVVQRAPSTARTGKEEIAYIIHPPHQSHRSSLICTAWSYSVFLMLFEMGVIYSVWASKRLSSLPYVTQLAQGIELSLFEAELLLHPLHHLLWHQWCKSQKESVPEDTWGW